MGLCDEVHESLHVAICGLIKESLASGNGQLLDVGCWDGKRTMDYAQVAEIGADQVAGLEYFSEQASIARARFDCRTADIEAETFPFSTGETDIVICNQVFEHCKNIFLPLSEIHRVLRVGGSLIFSVPNLASLHNRLMLLFGRQPTSMRVLGPHVRGLTHRAVLDFLTFNELFRVERVVGVGFYPLPSRAGDVLAHLLPHLSHTTVVRVTKTGVDARTWDVVMRERSEQTAFYES
jgi:SAM-dependent methyltransferase